MSPPRIAFPAISTPSLLLALASAAVLAGRVSAQSWPQYNGPGQGRAVPGAIGLRDWPDGGPAPVWKVATKLGFSSFTVADSRAFTLVARDGEETCVALDVETGEELWARAFAGTRYDRGGASGASDNKGGDGPRSTPSHDGEHVYVFDAQLVLHCLKESNGEQVWQRDLIDDHDGRNVRWQNAASPLIDGDSVFVAGGGAGQSLLAIDKKTGKVQWQAHDEQITHATPIAADIHGDRQIIFFMQSGLVSVKRDTGALLWRIKYPFRISTAASPVVDGNVVYCSAGYGVGAGAYEIIKEDGEYLPELLWRQRNKLMNHWSTPVAKDGYLYGMFSFKKYGTGPLKCVDLRTGETKWSTAGFGPGNCILVGKDLIALSDKGEVVLVEASPDKYSEVARADVLRGKCWSSPSFANGQLFVRSTVEGARLDLSGRSDGR